MTTPAPNPSPADLPPNILETKRAAARRCKAERMSESARMRRLTLWGQLILFVILVAMWPLPIFNPVKLLVVLFHETSHMIAAYVTGGVVIGLAVDPGGAGVTLGLGGWEPLIVVAGYAGSLLIGALLFYFSAEWPPLQVWLVLMVICCASLSMGWLNDFTAVFGIGTMLALFLGFAFPGELKKFLIRVVATTSCLYSVIDVLGEALLTPQDGFIVRGRTVGSDVAQMAGLSGLPEWLLAIVWGAGGLIVAVACMRWAARRDWEHALEDDEGPDRDAGGRGGGRFKFWRFDPQNPEAAPEYTIR